MIDFRFQRCRGLLTIVFDLRHSRTKLCLPTDHLSNEQRGSLTAEPSAFSRLLRAFEGDLLSKLIERPVVIHSFSYLSLCDLCNDYSHPDIRLAASSKLRDREEQKEGNAVAGIFPLNAGFTLCVR